MMPLRKIKGTPSTPSPLRLYSTEAAARKSTSARPDFRGNRLTVVLYTLPTEGGTERSCLLSSPVGMTVAKKRWVEKHRATVTKLGTFCPGRNFAPVQKSRVRGQEAAAQE